MQCQRRPLHLPMTPCVDVEAVCQRNTRNSNYINLGTVFLSHVSKQHRDRQTHKQVSTNSPPITPHAHIRAQTEGRQQQDGHWKTCLTLCAERECGQRANWRQQPRTSPPHPLHPCCVSQHRMLRCTSVPWVLRPRRLRPAARTPLPVSGTGTGTNSPSPSPRHWKQYSPQRTEALR